MEHLEFKGPRARVSDLRARFGLTAQDIADATASDPRSVRRWSTQSEDRRSRVDDHIRHLEQVTTVLTEVGVSDASVRIWLREPNRYLHGHTPLAELGAGRGDAVVDAARALAEGAVGVSATPRPTADAPATRKTVADRADASAVAAERTLRRT